MLIQSRHRVDIENFIFILIHYAFPYSFHMLLFIISLILNDLFLFKILYMENKIDIHGLNWSRGLHGPWPELKAIVIRKKSCVF